MKRSTKILVAWNIAVTLVLGAVALGSGSPASADVQVFTQQVGGPTPRDDGGDGSSATADDLVETTAPDALVAVTTTGLSTRHPHICLVTASAEASFVADGVFVFGLALDAAAPTAAADRRIEMFNNPSIADDSFEEVSTTMAFANLTGDHTFTFSARKSAADDGNLNVSASSITAVCVKKDV
jgi:hypothetical protein